MLRACLVTICLVAATATGADEIVTLPGTEPLDWQEDLSDKMLDGAHRFIERKIDESVARRGRHWHRDQASREAYEKSIGPNRARFMGYIGAVDPRVPIVMERFGDDDRPALVAETDDYRVWQVRWPVLEGVFGEGLLESS